MLITCYVFSDRTLQVGHTYYSVHFSTTPLHLNLEDYKNSHCLYIPFVYEVEVNSDDVFGLTRTFIASRTYKIKRKIEPRKIFKNINLSELEKKELEAIFKGDVTDDDMYKDYCLPMKKAPYELSESEHRKILAYLSYKYDLSIVELKDEAQLEYIKLLEYYKRQYSISEFSTFEKTSSKCEQQKLKGTRKFEIIFNRDPSELVYNVWLNDYIMSRQLTQSQFNQLCNYIKTEEVSVLLGVISNSIKAGYEILPEYRELFYPYILYHAPTKNLDLITNDYKRDEAATALFYCGYKFKNYDYNNMDNYYRAVVEAKTIFSNEFKYIE